MSLSDKIIPWADTEAFFVHDVKASIKKLKDKIDDNQYSLMDEDHGVLIFDSELMNEIINEIFGDKLR